MHDLSTLWVTDLLQECTVLNWCGLGGPILVCKQFTGVYMFGGAPPSLVSSLCYRGLFPNFHLSSLYSQYFSQYCQQDDWFKIGRRVRTKLNV